MRTSGAESDVVLYMVPVIVLAVLTVIFLGGPAQAVEVLDSSIVDALHWLRSQW